MVLSRRFLCEVILKGNFSSNLCCCYVSLVNVAFYQSGTVRSLYNKVKSIEISEILKAENIKECLERLQNLVVPTRLKTKPPRSAAVLIPLCVKDDELSLLFTLRKGDLRQHKRQVSFPGGVQEKNESLIETALRETEEELGFNRKRVAVWGHGNPVDTIDYSVLPVVGFIGDISSINFNPNPSEVECIFTVPLYHFCDKNNCKYTRFRFKRGGNYLMPAYINVHSRIWGLTATLTHLFLMSLLPNEYTHRLPIVSVKS